MLYDEDKSLDLVFFGLNIYCIMVDNEDELIKRVLFFFKLIFMFRFCLIVFEKDFKNDIRVEEIVVKLVVFLWIKIKLLGVVVIESN